MSGDKPETMNKLIIRLALPAVLVGCSTIAGWGWTQVTAAAEYKAERDALRAQIVRYEKVLDQAEVLIRTVRQKDKGAP